MTDQSRNKNSRDYSDRVERYAQARQRNRKRACREAGSELRSTVQVLLRERDGEKSDIQLRKSA